MNATTMPGFTADASFNRSSAHYLVRAMFAGPRQGGQVSLIPDIPAIAPLQGSVWWFVPPVQGRWVVTSVRVQRTVPTPAILSVFGSDSTTLSGGSPLGIRPLPCPRSGDRHKLVGDYVPQLAASASST